MIALHEAALLRRELRARMEFRYGIAAMTEMPHVLLRLEFGFDRIRQVGVAADNLPPKWFTKNPTQPLAPEITEMISVIGRAIAHAREIRASTPFEFWRELYARQSEWAKQQRVPPLLAHFGTSLVERALIDAFCRATKISFARALRENAFGVDLGLIRPALAGSAPRDWLPEAPAPSVFARHTVGLSDPIDADDLADRDRVSDGLPQTLAECVRFYGLRHFKIKINGDLEADRARLGKISAVLRRECSGVDFAFSLDGNESFRDAAAFADYARKIFSMQPAEFWARLLFIEQPLHRDVALTSAATELVRAWPGGQGFVIDESDATLESLPAALELGYAGTSHKNCKGVFKGLANTCLLAQRRKQKLPALLSGEDLTNVGPVALLQDLAVQAALGITSVERNGHHYFAGLLQFPTSIQEAAAKHHGDIFVAHEQGRSSWPRVNIQQGKIAIGSVNAAPFGFADELGKVLGTGESWACVALE